MTIPVHPYGPQGHPLRKGHFKFLLASRFVESLSVREASGGFQAQEAQFVG